MQELNSRSSQAETTAGASVQRKRPPLFLTEIEMTKELQELIISAKDAALQMAENTRLLGKKVKENPRLIRLMAAIAAMEKSQ
jgi:hypothetical protein